jgi:zinc transport system substrate-binding protein
MQKISDSKAYFILGHLDFEETWLLRFSTANPAMHIVNTGDGIQNLVGHAHQHSNETYSHSVDPHIWLSTSCMKIQAQHICETLCKLDSQNKIQYLDKLLSFNILADSINMSIKKIFRDSQQKTILIFHPALGYFARDYGLEQISIEQEGKEPSPAHLAELIKAAKSRNLSKIFISKEFDTRHAESLAKEINAKVVVFDPMAEAWPENMLQLATLIASN